MDTGQSSSLVAVHLAVESLRRGESAMAIAGGVNLNLVPDSTISAERFGALSPDGLRFTFDARTNGYVRGEGGAFVVFKPLRAAVADGDPVYCVLHGSAVNNDGSTEELGVPSPAGQQNILRQAYERAQMSAEQVQYVELHGTGTKLGDPIEASALGAVLGDGRVDGAELWVGSVKTNVGYLEGAAGIVGLLKAALCIRHGEFVPKGRCGPRSHGRSTPDAVTAGRAPGHDQSRAGAGPASTPQPKGLATCARPNLSPARAARPSRRPPPMPHPPGIFVDGEGFWC